MCGLPSLNIEMGIMKERTLPISDSKVKGLFTHIAVPLRDGGGTAEVDQ